MGENLSKDCNAPQGSAVIPGQTDAMGSRKNNIVLMNPEIHFHTNQSSTDSKNESTSTDEPIKKLNEELNVKQNEIDLERNMRKSERVFYENLIREKDCQIEDQNKIILEQEAQLEKVFRNRDERNQHEGPAKRKKTLWESDERNTLWEWDGTKWIEIPKNTNSVTQIRHQVCENRSNKQSSKPKNQNSIVQSQTNVPVRSTVNDGTTKVTVLSTPAQTENIRVCRSAISSEHNYASNLTYLRQPEVANKKDVSSPAIPNDVSIDEREIRNH